MLSFPLRSQWRRGYNGFLGSSVKQACLAHFSQGLQMSFFIKPSPDLVHFPTRILRQAVHLLHPIDCYQQYMWCGDLEEDMFGFGQLHHFADMLDIMR